MDPAVPVYESTGPNGFAIAVNKIIYAIAIMLGILAVLLTFYGMVVMCNKFAQIKRVRPTDRKKKQVMLESESPATERGLMPDNVSYGKNAREDYEMRVNAPKIKPSFSAGGGHILGSNREPD